MQVKAPSEDKVGSNVTVKGRGRHGSAVVPFLPPSLVQISLVLETSRGVSGSEVAPPSQT